MPRDNSFRDYIVEDVLGHVEGITSRAVFSGWGIYLDGVIVGLIIDGTFCLKTNYDSKESGEFFKYDKKGKTVKLPYITVPEETMEDREAIKERILESFEISQSSQKSKSK